MCYVNTLNWTEINQVVGGAMNFTFTSPYADFIRASFLTTRSASEYYGLSVKPECASAYPLFLPSYQLSS